MPDFGAQAGRRGPSNSRSIALSGTVPVPVIGVVASAIALGEPLGLIQIVALLFTLAGIVLATRS